MTSVADTVAYSSGDHRLGSKRPTATACMDLNQHYKETQEAERRASELADRCAGDVSGRQTAIKYITSLGRPLPTVLKPYAPIQVAEKADKPRPITGDLSDIVREEPRWYGTGGGRQVHKKPGAE